MLEGAELDGRACFTLKRFVAGFAELLEFPNFIVTVFIGFPDRMTLPTNGVAIVRVVPRRFI